MTGDGFERYKAYIDALVEHCERQGSIGARKAIKGVWNQNPDSIIPEEQQRVNTLLSELSPDQRAVLAEMLRSEFVGGVFMSLVVLRDGEYQLTQDGVELPLTPTGYESFEDFTCRRLGLDWPDGEHDWSGP